MVNIVPMGQKLFIALSVVFLFTASCQSGPPKDPVTNDNYYKNRLTKLSANLVKGASRPPEKVAILDFVNANNGKTSQFGKFITSKFVEVSVSKNLFVTPAEGEVAKAMKQLKINYNGTLDGLSAGKLGDALGCDSLIFGTVSDLQKGSDVDLTLKMVDSKTGNIVSAASASFVRSKQVSAMLESF